MSLDTSELYFEPRLVEPPVGLGAAKSNGHSTGRPARQLFGTPASEIAREEVEWLEPGRVPIGLVTVLAGIGGLGKSQWTCLLAARLSRGELGAPAATILATAEDSPSTTVVPRLEALEAELELVHFVQIADGDRGEDGIELPRDIRGLGGMIRDLRARLLIVDPLVAHLPLSIDAHRDQSVRRALAPLYRLAKDTGCAVVAVLHLNKSTGLTPLQRIGGSSGFGDAARSVLLLDRDPDDPDGAGRVLAHVKCNVGPTMPSLLYRVAPIVLPAAGNAPMVKTSRLEFVGESRFDGAELLDPDASVEVSDCEQFLRDFLADGEQHPSADVFAEGRRNGFSESALKRARRKAGVSVTRSGFPSRSYWQLTSLTRTELDGVDELPPHSGHTHPPKTHTQATSASQVVTERGERTVFDDDIPL